MTKIFYISFYTSTLNATRQHC